MDCFDDIQIEETLGFDFVEEINDNVFDDEENDRLFPTINPKFDFNEYINGNYDY